MLYLLFLFDKNKFSFGGMGLREISFVGFSIACIRNTTGLKLVNGKHTDERAAF